MLVKKVQKRIRERNMISANERIIVGLSGGADSVCLLLVLCKLREVFDFSLEAVHVEHGIRGEESRQDADFSEQLCKQLNIFFQMIRVDVPKFAAEKALGLEEAARLLRYEVFEQVAKERKAKIALAHHMEDNAETILFQMLRGSSLTGLCGMQEVRESETGVTYIRPLLSLHRAEIEYYLEMQEQEYCTDSTNQELEYSRNYLRNVIIPEFTKINHQAVVHINESAGYLREVRGFMDEQVQFYWEQIATVDEDILLDLNKLKQLHAVMQKEIIYKAIGRMAGGKKDIASVHVEQVLELIQKQSGKEITLPNGVVAIKENATIRFFLFNKNKGSIEKESCISVCADDLMRLLEDEKSLVIPLAKNGKFLEISTFQINGLEDEIPQKTYTKWFDYDKIVNGFCIRKRRSGDYLICDVSGHRKKLKQYFVDEKIPVTKRDEIFILAQDEAVLWVVGGRMSEHVKVSKDTRVVVEITYKEEA